MLGENPYHEPQLMTNEVKMNAEFKDEILREQIRLVMKQVPTMQVGSFITALVLAYVVRHNVAPANILVWVLMVLLIALSRVVLYYRFRKVRWEPFRGEYWKNIYLTFALISGITWGASAFIIFPAGNLGLICLFALVMASLSAATTVSHSSIRSGSAAWVGPAMLPYAIRCFVEGGEFRYTLGFLIILYVAAILRHSFIHYRSIASAITLRFENLELLTEVQRVNDVLRRDIAKQMMTEEALRASEEKFRLAFLTNPDSINLNRVNDGMYLDINEGFTKIMGYTREEAVGKTSFELNIWEDFKIENALSPLWRAKALSKIWKPDSVEETAGSELASCPLVYYASTRKMLSSR